MDARHAGSAPCLRAVCLRFRRFAVPPVLSEERRVGSRPCDLCAGNTDHAPHCCILGMWSLREFHYTPERQCDRSARMPINSWTLIFSKYSFSPQGPGLMPINFEKCSAMLYSGFGHTTSLIIILFVKEANRALEKGIKRRNVWKLHRRKLVNFKLLLSQPLIVKSPN